VFESGGWFVNQEGRAQRAEPVYRGGVPIVETGGGGHPPRVFRRDVPGGAPEPAWRLLGEVGSALSRGGGWEEDPLQWLRRRFPRVGTLAPGERAGTAEIAPAPLTPVPPRSTRD
jgi:hypothetical protein